MNKKVLLVHSDDCGWPERREFDSEQELRDHLNEEMCPADCADNGWNPSPLMIDCELNVTEFEGYVY